MRIHSWAVLAVALTLPLAACKDTKTLQENDQLKQQVTELQKENGQLGNQVESLTADRDSLAKQNQVLEAKLAPRKKKHSATKSSKRKKRQT